MKDVLIIEDDDWLADSYAHCLESKGYTVRVVHQAAAAMEAIDECLPDVVVADIILGQQNSLTLLNELQSYADTAALPVIVCTSLNFSGRERASLSRYGVVEVLNKITLRPDALADAVEAATRQ